MANIKNPPTQDFPILVVDDDPVTRSMLSEFLEQEGFQVYLADSADTARAIFVKNQPQLKLVLSDIKMEESDGLSLLRNLKSLDEKLVMILMTGFGSMEDAMEAIQKGAFDYISKPFDLSKLLALILKAKRQVEIQSQEMPSDPTPTSFQPPKVLIGKSPQMVELYRTMARATLSHSTVLITGESGTGKELVARGVHDNSERKNKKFVAVNCGALSEHLLESELFGHVKGSFTGAIQDKKGLFEEAESGTLFLDEIGDITPSLQVKLLRVIQEGDYRPVGSTQSKKANIRLIAATHRNVDQLVKDGKFREDLYYRLKVIEIHLPALRERKDDIQDLAVYFLKRFSAKVGKNVRGFSPDAITLLKQYTWPGNVRELEHQIERAVALSSASKLEPEEFDLKGSSLNSLESNGFEDTHAPSRVSSQSLEDLEKTHILKVLKSVDYNKSRASEILGIDRATLYRKASRYGIEIKSE